MDVKGYVKKEQMYIDICIECYNATYYLHIITLIEITFSLGIFFKTVSFYAAMTWPIILYVEQSQNNHST